MSRRAASPGRAQLPGHAGEDLDGDDLVPLLKYCGMPTTANGDVSLYYETFGADDDPAWGTPACFDVERITSDAYAAYDRCWDPEGQTRQAKAISASPSREAALATLRMPV